MTKTTRVILMDNLMYFDLASAQLYRQDGSVYKYGTLGEYVSAELDLPRIERELKAKGVIPQKSSLFTY